MIYLFHGADTFSAAETVADLRARLAREDEAARFNDSDLDGARLTLGALEEAASALPFMGQRRLVVVRGLLARCNPKSADSERSALATGLVDYLARVPETTRLVFIDHDLHANNPVRRWAERQAGQDRSGAPTLVVKAFAPPKPAALPAWLAQRAGAQGGDITPDACRALTEALVREGVVDLRLASSELNKLLTYANGNTVTPDDVALLVAPVSLDSIFGFVDALGDRNGPAAITLLHQFMNAGEPPLRILALVVRQMRLLALTRGLLDARVNQRGMAERLPVPGFLVAKLVRQARRFPMAYLEAAICRLAELDAQIKTGRVAPAVGLDLFVTGICGAPTADMDS